DIGDLVAPPSHLVKPDIPSRANTQISIRLAEAARVCLEYVQVRVRPVERRLEDVMQSGELNVAWDFKPTPDGWLRPPDVDPEPENRPGPGPPRDSSVPRLGLLRFGQRAQSGAQQRCHRVISRAIAIKQIRRSKVLVCIEIEHVMNGARIHRDLRLPAKLGRFQRDLGQLPPLPCRVLAYLMQ